MRKFILTAFVFGISLCLLVPAHAEEEEVDPDRIVDTEISRIHEKAKRGATNILTFPLEVPKQAKGVVDEGGDNYVKRAALVVPGVLKGVGYGVIRLGSGVWDLFTFNSDYPKDHEPFLKPNYVWDEEEKE